MVRSLKDCHQNSEVYMEKENVINLALRYHQTNEDYVPMSILLYNNHIKSATRVVSARKTLKQNLLHFNSSEVRYNR